MSAIPTLLERALRKESATPCCAYCHSPEYLLGITLEVDHIMPQSLGGLTELANLCLACRSCNGYKSDKTRGRDPNTGRNVKLFHPRRQSWAHHFCWSNSGTQIIGLTATGRATIAALQMNHELIANLRGLWAVLQLHPQES
jgi:hypothetical protein